MSICANKCEKAGGITWQTSILNADASGHGWVTPHIDGEERVWNSLKFAIESGSYRDFSSAYFYRIHINQVTTAWYKIM